MKGGLSLFALFLIGATILAAVSGQLLLKTGISKIGKIDSIGELFSKGMFFKMLTNIFILAGLCLYALSAVLWLGALSSLDLSYAYPLMSISYIITVVLAFVFLKENITIIRWGGVALIVLGSILISRT